MEVLGALEYQSRSLGDPLRYRAHTATSKVLTDPELDQLLQRYRKATAVGACPHHGSTASTQEEVL